MKRTTLWMLVGCLAATVFAGEQISRQTLTAEQIVDKNVAARGGLDAWRKVQTMVWTGRVDSANAPAQELPFVLAMKRPNKTRFEISVLNQKAVRVFDGKQGWKLSPSGNMGTVVPRPYTVDELKSAQDEQVIDGLLVDHEAKGVHVALEGTDQVAGHDAYRLAVTLPSGTVRHVWVDAKTFLDVRHERLAHDAHGQKVTVQVTYGDYKEVDGLQIPLTIESGTDQTGKRDTLRIDRVTLNPPLEDVIFGKPIRPSRRRSVEIDVDAAPAAPAMRQPAH